MPERPDVDTRIKLDRVDNLVISETAVAEIVLRNATTAGPVKMERVSITQDLDFAQAVFNAPAMFEQVEVLEKVIFIQGKIRAPIMFRECIFRGQVSFDDSFVQAPLLFENSTFEQELLFQEMTVLAPIILRGTNHMASVTFARSTVDRPLTIENALPSDMLLDEVTANEYVHIKDTTLSGLLSFRRGSYHRELRVQKSTCKGAADLTEISARHKVIVKDVTFEDNVYLYSGAYADQVLFRKTVFRGDTVFNGSTFHGQVLFRDVTFQGNVEFRNVRFANSVAFIDVIFEKSVSFQEAQFCGGILFDRVAFRGDVDFDLAAVQLRFRKALFSGQVSLRFGWADVVFEESDFPGPTRLGTSWLDHPLNETFIHALEMADKAPEDRRPRLLSLSGSNVSNLVLTDLDLKFCRFAGANNINSLRIEQANPFSVTPDGWRFSRRRPFLATWTSRGAIAEEHLWRSLNGLGVRKEGWLTLPSLGTRLEQIPQADNIQRIYRDLRKGREDRKDEPGAADFYYGEMEMRRHATTRWIERRILDLYWLISGYALRAWRALVTLIILLVAASLIFMTQGFDRNGGTMLRAAQVQSNGRVVYTKYALPSPPHDFGTALRYSIESATSLLRAPQPRRLTAIGQATEVLLRLLGPGLLGLAILSLRGRVKR
jgi:uncharacterized protein YjbI with pentapeptide repeats